MKCCRNFPNPFKAITRIEYTIPSTSKIGFQVYNQAGELVYRLLTHVQTPGKKNLHWDGRNIKGKKVPTGEYFYVINVDNAYELSNTMTITS